MLSSEHLGGSKVHPAASKVVIRKAAVRSDCLGMVLAYGNLLGVLSDIFCRVAWYDLRFRNDN